MKNKLMIIGTIFAIIFGIYGLYWVGKTSSYNLFYESMVEDTIRGMVKPEYLK